MPIWSYMRGSKMLDVKVGYHCNNKCIHCVVDPVRQKIMDNNSKQNLNTQEVLDLISDAKDNGVNTIVLTGGEITIRKDFKKILTHAADKGLKVNIQTNGRFFSQKQHSEFMVDLPGLFFIIALHGPTAQIHDMITQEKGSFQETVDAIINLREINKEIALKIVISNFNHNNLFETVLFAKNFDVNEFNIVFPHALDFEEKLFKKVVPKYYLLKDEIIQSANFSEKEHFPISFETIPYCICPDSQAFWKRNCDLLSKAIQNTESRQNALELEKYLLNWNEIRPKMKEKWENCIKCVFNLLCEGPWKEYVQYYGHAEFVPITEDKILDLLEEDVRF